MYSAISEQRGAAPFWNKRCFLHSDMVRCVCKKKEDRMRQQEEKYTMIRVRAADRDRFKIVAAKLHKRFPRAFSIVLDIVEKEIRNVETNSWKNNISSHNIAGFLTSLDQFCLYVDGIVDSSKNEQIEFYTVGWNPDDPVTGRNGTGNIPYTDHDSALSPYYYTMTLSNGFWIPNRRNPIYFGGNLNLKIVKTVTTEPVGLFVGYSQQEDMNWEYVDGS